MIAKNPAIPNKKSWFRGFLSRLKVFFSSPPPELDGERHVIGCRGKYGEVKMTAEDMQELLYSLAWAPWSACHYENAKRLLKSFFPGANWGDALENFTEIILSPPQKGSPK